MTFKINIPRTRSFFTTWLLVVMVAGYPLAAVLVTFLQLDSQVVTVPYRIAVFFFALMIFLSGTIYPLKGKPSVTLIIFSSIYLVRLVYDAYFADNEFAPNALLFFLVANAVPMVAVAFSIDEHFKERSFSAKLLVASALCLLGYYFLLWTGRISFGIGTRASLDALNPISLGQISATAIIAAIYLAISRLNLLSISAAIGVMAIAVPALFSSGSRGPIVALIAAVVWLSSSSKRHALILIPALTVGAFFIPTDNLAMVRLLGVFDTLDRSSSARLELQASALSDFLERPFLGKQFMDASFGEGAWPHNFFLESAMAMGMLGLGLAITLVFFSFKAALFSVNRTNPLTVSLFVQAIVAAQFSGSLWSGAMLFSLMSAVLSLGKVNRRRIFQYPSGQNAPFPRLSSGSVQKP